jgi:uncharacterized membrane protein
VALVIVVALLASVALVGRFYHFATDTAGAMLYCTAVVIAVGLLVDVVANRIEARLS